MSSHYFSLLFKQSMGLTPHQYVIRTRVDRAKKLLLKGEMSIVDIAQTVGFANQSHLNLHFKCLVGLTPKQFKLH
jgi:AraC family transcriptional regulator